MAGGSILDPGFGFALVGKMDRYLSSCSLAMRDTLYRCDEVSGFRLFFLHLTRIIRQDQYLCHFLVEDFEGEVLSRRTDPLEDTDVERYPLLLERSASPQLHHRDNPRLVLKRFAGDN